MGERAVAISLDQSDGLGQSVLGHVHRQHFRALSGEKACARPADAACRAGHDRPLACQSCHTLSPIRSIR
jgi:hypothetical protein